MSINYNNTKLPVSIHYSNGAGVTLPVGFIFPAFATDTYTPSGSVPVDGKEYSQDEFPTVYTDYLIAGKLPTCTYTEFTDQVTLTGNCGKFALDTVNQKFKVPLLKDGDSITQATSAGEIGKSYKAGLPNITGSTAQGWFSNAGQPSGAFYKGSNFSYPLNAGGPIETQNVLIDASRSSSIYGKSTTVQTEGVRLRYFVMLVAVQNNDSIFDWSNYMAALSNKADVNLSNLEASATEVIRSKITLRNLGTRTTTGVWEINNVVVDKALWISYVANSSGAPSGFACYATSGAVIGSGKAPDAIWMVGRGLEYTATNSLLIKPTNSTVVITVMTKYGDGGTLYAEQ